MKVLPGHNGPVISLLVTKNGWIVSGSADKTIKIWFNDLTSSSCFFTLSGHTDSITCLLERTDGLLLSGWEWSRVELLFKYQSYYRERKCASFTISCLWCTQQCFTLCVCLFRSSDKTVRCWDMKNSFSQLWSLKADDSYNGVWSICQMSDGRLLAGGGDKTLKIWRCYWYVGSFDCLINWFNEPTKQSDFLLTSSH